MNFKQLPQGAHSSALNFDKAVEVQAGQRLNFGKDNPTVTRVRVELYWQSQYDADASIVIAGANGRMLPGLIPAAMSRAAGNPDKRNNETAGMVWYNNLAVQGVIHSGDAREANDDPSAPEETIIIDLNDQQDGAEELIIIASTFPEDERPNVAIPFGRIRNCKVMIVDDETGDVLYVFELDEDFSTATSVELAKFYRRNGSWNYTSMGDAVGTAVQGLVDIAGKYQ